MGRGIDALCCTRDSLRNGTRTFTKLGEGSGQGQVVIRGSGATMKKCLKFLAHAGGMATPCQTPRAKLAAGASQTRKATENTKARREAAQPSWHMQSQSCPVCNAKVQSTTAENQSYVECPISRCWPPMPKMKSAIRCPIAQLNWPKLFPLFTHCGLHDRNRDAVVASRPSRAPRSRLPTGPPP